MCVFQALCMYVCMSDFAYLLQVFDPEASLQHSVFQFYCVLARTLPKHGDDCFFKDLKQMLLPNAFLQVPCAEARQYNLPLGFETSGAVQAYIRVSRRGTFVE